MDFSLFLYIFRLAFKDLTKNDIANIRFIRFFVDIIGNLSNQNRPRPTFQNQLLQPNNVLHTRSLPDLALLNPHVLLMKKGLVSRQTFCQIPCPKVAGPGGTLSGTSVRGPGDGHGWAMGERPQATQQACHSEPRVHHYEPFLAVINHFLWLVDGFSFPHFWRLLVDGLLKNFGMT